MNVCRYSNTKSQQAYIESMQILVNREKRKLYSLRIIANYIFIGMIIVLLPIETRVHVICMEYVLKIFYILKCSVQFRQI